MKKILLLHVIQLIQRLQFFIILSRSSDNAIFYNCHLIHFHIPNFLKKMLRLMQN